LYHKINLSIHEFHVPLVFAKQLTFSRLSAVSGRPYPEHIVHPSASNQYAKAGFTKASQFYITSQVSYNFARKGTDFIAQCFCFASRSPCFTHQSVCFAILGPASRAYFFSFASFNSPA
jgi:hypothetical protein